MIVFKICKAFFPKHLVRAISLEKKAMTTILSVKFNTSKAKITVTEQQRGAYLNRNVFN